MATKAENKLRHFLSEDDLFDSNDNDVILGWVNELAQTKTKVRSYGQRHRLRRKLMEQTLRQVLDKDELTRIDELVEEKMEGGEE